MSSPDPADLAPHSCAVCGQMLSAMTGPLGDIRWIHSAPHVDHPTVAVPAGQINTNVRCDFCLADHAPWVLPVRDYLTAPGQWSRGDWAMCDTCHDDVAHGRWQAVVARAVTALSAAGTQATARSLDRMYRKLRANITGDARPR